MKVYFDEVGYPADFDITSELKELKSGMSNYYLIKRFYDRFKVIIDYWEELKPFYEDYQYGNLSKDKYLEIVAVKQNDFEISSYKGMYLA
jgi:hypothetical protein